jgi:hypothetical protein
VDLGGAKWHTPNSKTGAAMGTPLAPVGLDRRCPIRSLFLVSGLWMGALDNCSTKANRTSTSASVTGQDCLQTFRFDR